MENKPPIIGVTGGIGSGKSTVCKILESLGAITYYADDRAKWLMVNNQKLVDGVKNLFGSEAYTDTGLDRKFIAQKAFKDDTLLNKLNQLVHPVVADDLKNWIQTNQKSPLLLKEAALLFETGSYKSLDRTILVTAPEEIRIERVVKRDAHRSREDVKSIIAKQMSDEEKSSLADYVVVNDAKSSLIQQVMKLYSRLVIT
ncbi:dephospho-CoA kinase [Ekhidna sp.]